MRRRAGFALTGAALWRGSEFVPTPDEDAALRRAGPAVHPAGAARRAGRGGRGRATASCPGCSSAADLRGFLHCHTSYSDGSNTVEELALACRAAGYEYVGITDHSQAAAYAGGLTARRPAAPGRRDRRGQRRLDGIRVLKGVEADILADGRVDYDEQVLGAARLRHRLDPQPVQHGRSRR